MSILNSLPSKIGVATENTNGLMSATDKIAVNKINRIEEDVSNKMNKDEKIKSSQLDTSSDAAKIQPNNLSTAVKNMMSGNTPVNSEIAFKSLITDYYADNSVTAAKRTANGSIAVIVSDSFCNFNTNNDDEVILSIPANYTIYFGTERKVVNNIPETISLEKGTASIITYSKLEGITAYNADAVKEQDYIIGAFDGENVAMFNGRYTVNGSLVVADGSISGKTLKDFSVDSRKLAIQHGTILADKTVGPLINVNFKSKFIEIINSFDVNIGDQYSITITKSKECTIPDNTNNRKYLYIYYDLGTGKLNANWSSSDITKTILSNDDKLVLIGIVTTTRSLAINNEYISINSVSTKNKSIEYTDILSGVVIVDLMGKTVTSTNLKAIVDNEVIDLLESDSQTIKLTDEIVNNMVNSSISYTLAAVKSDFTNNTYRLVFDKTENIKSIGLEAILITTIKKYTAYSNKESIIILKKDGNPVKSSNIISTGYTLPIDDETVVLELTTEIEEGNLILKSTTVPGTSIVDPMTNNRYDITSSLTYQTVVNNLHGLYGVLYNTETGKIEIVPQTNILDNRVYISLGFVNELSDSLAYTATGEITNHITLNSNRPSNYKVISGPDPDKGYDWANNRLVVPNDIYLLSNTLYTLYCQNMSMNRYIDNDYIEYEIALPTNTSVTENAFNVNIPVTGVYDTLISGKFKGNNNCLFKDTTLHIINPEAKDITVLCIGDDTVDLNMPSYIKHYLTSYGYKPTMIGTVKNNTTSNGYGIRNLTNEYGEGHKGWRLTDFMCRTKHKDNSPYYISSNPFMNNSKFDFSNYMKSHSYDSVDVVVISVGLNDITGYHTASTLEDILNLTIYQNMEQLPNLYKEMITDIHKFDSNIKIIINPTMINGIDDDFNRKSLMLTETVMYDLKDINNVFFVPGYLSQPLFTGTSKPSLNKYPTSSSINDTKLGSPISSSEINGMGQSNLAFMITSTIIGITNKK